MSPALQSFVLVTLFIASVAGAIGASAIARWHGTLNERWLESARGSVPDFLLERSRKSVSRLTSRYRFIFTLLAAVSAVALWAIWFSSRVAR
ncbi:MAG TPA: hypothetical protein VHX17_06120 [Candidatus Cybelea sp.]|jgi:hypothetical protein|nr:hypothetical protein [Candidatus Cybelea sp.]